MSLHAFNNALDTALADPNDEVTFSFINDSESTGQQIPTDPAMSDTFQFGSPGAHFGHTSNSPFLRYPNDIENGTFSSENLQSTPSIDHNPFAEGDQMLSWSSSTTPSSHSFVPCDSTTLHRDTSTEAGVLRVSHSQGLYSSIDQDAPLFGGGETMDMNVGIKDARTSEMEPSTCLSQEQSGSASVGWTYRQILEIVAIPPPEGLRFWHAKVSQLAAGLGMPSGATGKDIINFVLQVASRKDELHKVVPLVKAFADAARVIEGRIVAPTTLLPVVLTLYPAAGPLARIMAIGAELNGEGQCGDSEITSEEEESLKDDSSHDGDDKYPKAVAEADAGTEVGDATPSPRYKEADLYCRVGDCLHVFKNPWTCAQHRLTHFLARWVCPGPCQLEDSGSDKSPVTGTSKFASADSLRRHLLNHPACERAVLKALNVEELPESGTAATAILTPFRNHPERRWEDYDYELTDLKSVKEKEMKLRNSGCTA